MNNSINARSKLGSKPAWLNGIGPYIGRVVNHLDTEYMGSLEVELIRINEASGVVEDSGYVIPCTYVSPFAGQTPHYGLTDNDGFEYTQKSYGFWAIPPDVGVRVLVLMAENNYSYGFWIGCIQDKFMNFMMPGNTSTTIHDNKGGLNSLSKGPVGEYNKRTVSGYGNDPSQYVKPVDDRQTDILNRQGLLKPDEYKIDEHRGLVTSSARRDIPSMVFGWSSPGPADIEGPTVEYGTKDWAAQVPFNRLGGTSIVMDDGDQTKLRTKTPKDDAPDYQNLDDPTDKKKGDNKLLHNELFRIRTRTGHQILMHNTEDLIYIINSQGTAWIELTNNGKIDVYSYDSVSVHSEMDINLKAERDINLEASGNINFKAKEQMRMESGNATHWKVGTAETKKGPGERDKQRRQDDKGDRVYRIFEDLEDVEQPGDNLYIDVSRDVHFKVGTHEKLGDFKLEISQDYLITVDRDFNLIAKRKIHQTSDEETYHLAKKSFHQKTDMSFHQQSKATMHIKSSTSDVRMTAANNVHSKAGANNYMGAGVSNHIKANSSNHINASTNHMLGSVNRLHAIQQFGTGASPASPAISAAGATPAIPPELPECAHHAWIPIRIPMHEPYMSHENLNPDLFKPDKTDSTKSISDACTFTKEYEQEIVAYVATPDTFKKNNLGNPYET